jgi:hypothetical protein
MDLSSDPLARDLGSSPSNIDSIDLEMESNEAFSLAQPVPSFPTDNSTPIEPKEPVSSLTSVFINPFSTSEFSASSHRPSPLSLNRKRAPESATYSSQKEPRISTTQPDSARTVILQARDLIVQAYTLTISREEQTKLLDLLEVFREFTEKGRIQNASSILASQVANLESATRQIENRTKALNKASSTKSLQMPKVTLQPTFQPTTQPNSFASIASKGASNSTSQEWTIVGQPKPTIIKPSQKPKPASKENRLILVKSSIGTSASFSPLATRNALNKAFANKGIKGPVVTSVTKSFTSGQNLVITTTSPYTADFLLEKQTIWEHLIPFKSVQKDKAWFKVVLHGVPIIDFNTPEGMELIKEEIKTFNKGLNPIGTPYWLTAPEKRGSQRGGSVAIAFATETEANRAIQNRLYIAGISVRVEKHYFTAPSTQCPKCQGYGHLENYCRRMPKCRLCGESHTTVQHYCNICKTKGSKCPHLEPKCCNCSSSHTANTKTCEVLLAIKNKTNNITI